MPPICHYALILSEAFWSLSIYFQSQYQYNHNFIFSFMVIFRNAQSYAQSTVGPVIVDASSSG